MPNPSFFLSRFLIALTLCFSFSAHADWAVQPGNYTGTIVSGTFPTAGAACQAQLPNIPTSNLIIVPPDVWKVIFSAAAPLGTFPGGYTCGKYGSQGVNYANASYITATCQTGFVVNNAYPSGCMPATQPTSGKTLGKTDCQCGDPIDMASGNVYEKVIDYETAGPNKLVFARYYNSISGTTATPARTMAVNWRSTYDRYLIGSSPITAEREDGKQLTFTASGGHWTPEGDVDYTLTQVNSSTWVLTTPDDTVETYTGTGSPLKLSTIRARNGYTQTLTYNGSGQLATVTDSYTSSAPSRKLTFTYSQGLMQSVVTPENTLTYGYDYSGIIPTSFLNGATPIPDRLRTVIYPATPGSTPSGTVTYNYASTASTPYSPYLMTSVTDENGNVKTTWTYDTFGRGTSSQGYAGLNLTSFTYNDTTGGRTVTNALGEVETYGFTTSQGVPKVSSIARAANGSVAAATESFTYDGNGYVNGITDWNGNLTSFSNNSRGQPTQITEGSGSPVSRVTTLSYVTAAAPSPYPASYFYHLPATLLEGIAGVNPALRSTAFTYDTSGNLTSRAVSDGSGQGQPTRTWNYTYDATGLMLTAKDPRNNTTTLTYVSGALNTVTDPLSHVTTFNNFSSGGRPGLMTDANGVQRGFGYDARQHLIADSVSMSGGNRQTSYIWYANNELEETALADGTALGKTYKYEYPGNPSLLMAINDPSNNQVDYFLNGLGEAAATQTWDPSINVYLWRYATFDVLGRKVTDSNFDHTKTMFYTLDNDGNATTVTDPRGHATSQVFDARNRLSTSTDANGGVTSYAYDALDHVTSVSAPSGIVTSYIYDGFGDRMRETSPDSGVTNYAYDAAGNLTQKTDAQGVVANMAYDAVNRMTGRTYPSDATQNVTYTYDQAGHGFGIGRLTSVTDRPGSVSRFYDERGMLTREDRTVVGAVLSTLYSYNAAGRLASITTPSGAVVTYGRDSLGNVNSLAFAATGADSTSVISAASYLPFGPPSSLTYGNGEVETLTWDHDFNPTAVSSPSLQLSYGLDAASNVTSVTDALNASNSQTFGYDIINRLTSATSGSGGYGSLTWAYDANGNVSSSVANSVTTSYTTTANTNRLASLSGGANVTYSYPTTGNLGTATSGGVTTGSTYDAAGRLMSLATPSLYEGYMYGADGSRAVKQNGAQSFWTAFSYDQWGHLIYENDDNTGTAISEYIYLGDKLVGVWSPAQHHLYSAHTDRLGAPQVLTDHNRAVNWKAVYQPYGFSTVTTSSGPSGTPIQHLRLPGQYYDSEFGYLHNGWRDFNPGTGRYIQNDPIGLSGGMNTYRYAKDNPEMYTDPSGLSEVCGRLVPCNPSDPYKTPLQIPNSDQTLEMTLNILSIMPVGPGPEIRAAKTCVKYLNGARLLPDFVYRGDSRDENVIFEEGMTARGDSSDIFAHMENNLDPASMYISSSTSPEIASGFGDGQNVYVIRPTNGIDVMTLQSNPSWQSYHGNEFEILLPNRVEPSDIRAVTRGNQSILNPNWKP